MPRRGDTFPVTSRGIGRPDYAAPFPLGQQAKPTVYTLTDMAELAARLGSPSTYDRRGDVILIDDFENGINSVEITTSGTGAAAVWASDRYFRGGFSLKLTAGRDSDRYIIAKKYLFLPALYRVGFEIMATADANRETIEGYIDTYNGFQRKRWGYRYTKSTSIFEVLDSDGVWKTVISGVMYTSGYLFYPVKLVVDMANDVYTRLVSASVEIDLTDYAPVTTVDYGLVRMEVYEKLVSDAGTNTTMYLDSLIVTQNEPANGS